MTILSLDEINKENWFSIKDLLITNDHIYVSFTNEQQKIVGTHLLFSKA